jgi:hypothetical protein
MDQSFSKNFNFRIISDFGGYNSERDKTNIAENVLVAPSQNVYKDNRGLIRNRDGQKRRGSANGTLSPVSSQYVWNTSWGATYPLWITDNKLQVEIDNEWYTLLDSLTEKRYVFDSWWDNTEKKDRVLFVNGSDSIQHWAGGYAQANAQIIGGSTLTKSGSTTWQQAGFSVTSGEKKFKINGSSTEYTYTGGENTTTLTGITPALPAITQDDKIFSSVLTETDKPADGFSNDFIKVINNQLYVGSYTSRLCYISSSTDFKNFTVPTPREPGDPELLTLDDTLNGITVRQGKAYISFGTGGWAIVTFTDITVGTTLTQQTTVSFNPVPSLAAAYSHEFIDTIGDSIVYLSQDQQVRLLGDFTNLFQSASPTISQELYTELKSENFAGGSLRCIGDFTYICAPNSGKVYLYQVRQGIQFDGTVVSERIWQPPQIWNAVSIDEIDGVIYAFSNANPQLYEIWDTGQWYDDSPSGEELPYNSVAAFGYRNGGRRQGLISFDKYFSEGYITGGTPLTLTLNYNYLGSASQIVVPVNSDTRPAFLFQTPNPSLGDASLGDEPLGQGIADIGEDGLPKFKTINSVTINGCFEYQPTYSTDTANARWKLLSTGSNAKLEGMEQANFLINKINFT